LSKIAYGEQVGFRELGGLFLNQLWLEHKAKVDKQFNQKFGKTLEVSSNILKQLNISRGFNSSAQANLKKKITQELEAFLIPRRNLPQWKMRFDSSVILQSPKPSGVLKKNLPAERYIGIGYRDKGTAKNPAEDGSPSWQEIAQSNRSLDSRIEEIRNELKSEKDIKRKSKLQREWIKLNKAKTGVSDNE
jgi:hypothetical protein